MADISNLAELNAVLELCGCCPAPRCCPPVIQCQSAVMSAEHVGFFDDTGSASSIDRATLYRKRRTQDHSSPYEVRSEFPEYGEYVSESFSSSAYQASIEQWTYPHRATLNGSCFSEWGEIESTCEFGGSDTFMQFAVAREPEGAGWSYTEYKSYERVQVYSSAEGDITELWHQWETDAAEWDADHPDYPAEHAAWEAAHAAWVTDFAAWETAYQEWENGGSVGDPPEPPVEPEEPPARPVEPEKFYGPCTAKITMTETSWEREYHEGSWRTILTPPAETESGENPYTRIIYKNWGIGNVIDGPITTDITYEEPMTDVEFAASMEAWFASHVHLVFDAADAEEGSASGSGSSPCLPSALCYAKRESYVEFDSRYYSEVAFRFRIKLDKCCGYKTLKSRWQEVFYPQDWLDWELRVIRGDSNPGDEPMPGPDPSLRAWSWSGTPPLCGGSSSSSSVSAPLDPYDDPSMWSPFSAVIRVPDGKFGEVMNRNYQQQCYDSGSLWDDMPDVFGTFETISSSSSSV